MVHTRQIYDHEPDEMFFKGLGVRRPDYFLEVDTGSLGAVIGESN